jgi:NAD(P)-dependent dehydrogenase (short-subunit alcohol dehydrogenase family)
MTAMPQRAAMLFSSTASLFGAPGQGNYAAANAALEGFAASQNLTGRAITAVQWGAWAAGESVLPSSSEYFGVQLP